jgi:hypothetical protein
MAKANPSGDEIRSVFSQVRLLQIFSALERAGALPATVSDVHAFAFFSNVMSPLWSLEPLEGAVLKLAGGPYYPFLQKELDHLVGMGFLEIDNLYLARPLSGVAQLSPTFRLVPRAAAAVVEKIEVLPDEVETLRFLTELAFSFASIKRDDRVAAAIKDATFSNPAISDNRIIDFGEWNDPERSDASVRAANRFQKYAPAGITLNRAEKLSMYMSLVARRAHG